jgi:hypothetical protein
MGPVRPSCPLEQPVLLETPLGVQPDERVAHLQSGVEPAPVEQAHQVGKELVEQVREARYREGQEAVCGLGGGLGSSLDRIDDLLFPLSCLISLILLADTSTPVFSLTRLATTCDGLDGPPSSSSLRASSTSPATFHGPFGPLFFTPGPLWYIEGSQSDESREGAE